MDGCIAYISLMAVMMVRNIIEKKLPISLLITAPEALQFTHLLALPTVSSWSAKSASTSS